MEELPEVEVYSIAVQEDNLTTGWKKISGDWYYYDESGYMITDTTYDIGGKTYRFVESGKMVVGWYYESYLSYEWDYELDKSVEVWRKSYEYYHPSGELATGWVKVKGIYYYFNEYGGMFSNTAITLNGKTYRFTESGRMLTGWYNGPYEKRYYYESGVEATGWTKVEGSWYYFNDWQGMLFDTKEEIKGKTYRFTKSGKMVTGWYNNYYINEVWDSELDDYVEEKQDRWEYYDASGVLATGWTKVKNSWYYFNAYDNLAIGSTTIGRTQYEFKSSGVLQGNWVKDNKGIWFKTADGKYYKNQLITVGDNKYYFNSSGYVTKGWKKISNKWYYFDDLGIMAENGSYYISGKTYGFDKSGLLKTGWSKNYSDNWNYFNSSGVMAIGLTKVKGKSYFFGSEGDMLTNTSVTIDNKTYLFDKSGVMRSQGWYDAGYYEHQWNDKTQDYDILVWVNNWYYISKSGEVSQGWTKISNNWYYFDRYHTMVTGEEKIDRKENVFSSSGAWQGSWEENSKGIWLKPAKGASPKNQWKLLGESWYYFDKVGYVTTGWKKLNNNWYYFDEVGRMNNEEVSYIKGKEYLFNKSGTLFTGWHKTASEHWDYDEETGEESTYWVNEWKYYTVNGKETNTWRKDNNNWYYFDYNGSMVTGQDYADGELHEFADNGIWIGKVKY